ncbi:hypothetical protein HN446_01655 [bacterium]|nr:hypothetical protein [bacterium]
MSTYYLGQGLTKICVRYFDWDVCSELRPRDGAGQQFIDDVSNLYEIVKTKLSQMSGLAIARCGTKEVTELVTSAMILNGLSKILNPVKNGVLKHSASIGKKLSKSIGNKLEYTGLSEDIIANPFGAAVAQSAHDVFDIAQTAQHVSKTKTIPFQIAFADVSTSCFLEKDRELEGAAKNVRTNAAWKKMREYEKREGNKGPEHDPDDPRKKERKSGLKKFVPLENELEVLQREIGDGLKGYEELGNNKIQLNFKHFLQPDANKKGLPKGFHHNYLDHYTKQYKVTKTMDLKNGCYVAEWFNGKGTRASSFVPDSMTRLEYIKSVKEAYYNLIYDIRSVSGGIKKLIGKSRNGIVFEMRINNCGIMDSVFPCINEMIK